MTHRLAGKIAVVTGGATGIGFVSAKRFAAEDARVFITGRRQAELEVEWAWRTSCTRHLESDTRRFGNPLRVTLTELRYKWRPGAGLSADKEASARLDPNGRDPAGTEACAHRSRRQEMSCQQNIAFAQKLVEGIGGAQDPSEIAALFDANLLFEIQGDDGVLPWIGRRTGRQAIADFIRDIRTLNEPVAFDIEDILASDRRAVIIGALRTRIKATGKITAMQFAIILTITGDVVTRFQMLEDSFHVSKAART